MPQSVEERIAYLEGRVEEHTRGFGDLTTRIDGLSSRIDGLDQKVDRFRAELAARIDALSNRIDALDQKVEQFRAELSNRIDALSNRIDALDQKMSHQFIWLVGIQITVLLAVVGAVASVILARL